MYTSTRSNLQITPTWQYRTDGYLLPRPFHSHTSYEMISLPWYHSFSSRIGFESTSPIELFHETHQAQSICRNPVLIACTTALTTSSGLDCQVPVINNMRVAGYNQCQRLFQSFEIRLRKHTKAYGWNLSAIVQLEIWDLRDHGSAVREKCHWTHLYNGP